MIRKALFILLLTSLGFGLFAQAPTDTTRRPVKTKRAAPAPEETQSRTGSMVVDDSTKNPYGPTTTKWTTEREVFIGKPAYRPLDTSINNYHRWTWVQRSGNKFQDLGNNGTALNPIFPQGAYTIGASPGFYAYAPYVNPEIKLYNTKSPYTRMYVVWGGQGRAMTSVEYSRNINPKWNISFNYRPILTDKQILRAGRADRNVVSHYYDLSTHYATKDDRYRVFTAFSRIRHRVYENGGITFVVPANQDSTYDLFFQAVSPRLIKANSYEQHNKFHVFHEINVRKAQAYHIFEVERQLNWFRDDLSVDPVSYYDNLQIDTTKTIPALDSTRFTYVQNQVGLKGQIGKQNQIFYNGYYKMRSYNVWNRHMSMDTIALPSKALEIYLGGEVQYSIDSLQHINFLMEVLNGGYSRIETEGKTRWLDFSGRRLISKPTYLQTAYSGFFDLWSNDFKHVETTQLSVFPKVTVGPLFISPGITYTAFKNYIYFAKGVYPNTNQTVLPRQTDQPISYATPELRMDLTLFKRIHLRPQILYTHILQDNDSVLRVPKIFANGQLAYEGHWFHHNLQVQVGVDLHWHSSYMPMGYDPVIQTYYNQNTVKPPPLLLADLFLNGKIKRGRFFIKYHNIVQMITRQGAMPTPYYRGVASILDFGFDILLFD